MGCTLQTGTLRCIVPVEEGLATGDQFLGNVVSELRPVGDGLVEAELSSINYCI